MAGAINAANRFHVGARGNDIVILSFGRVLKYEEAMNLAAWLVTIAQAQAEFAGDEFSGETDFDAWLNAVRAS